MELSHEILDTIDVNDDKDVMEVIKHAITEENIIVESETTEETEIEEIIEIIEEIEEDKEESSQDDVIFTENKNEKVKSEMEVYAFDEDSSVFKTHSETKYEKKDRYNKSSNKQVIAYDVDEDWQDEDVEEEEYELRFENSSTSNNSTESLQRQRIPNDNKKYVNNQTISLPLQTSRLESRDSVEFSDKAEKSKLSLDFKNNVNNDENVDNNISHEIVKNVENNLLYTVLGTKKQSSVKTFQTDKLSNAHYIKVCIICIISSMISS